MPDQWFYTRDDNKLGPFSAEQLKELAAAGEIRPMDTVWKAGIEKGVVAAKVKNLFPAAPIPVADARQTPVADAPGSPGTAPSSEPPVAAPPLYVTPAPVMIPDPPIPSDLPPPPTEATKTNKASGTTPLQQRKGRATALKGAIIVGQDGYYLQYIKKCTVCGEQDRSKSRMPIKQGTTRAGFFCPKCRKVRQVEIQGII